jgi:hypothetical protein
MIRALVVIATLASLAACDPHLYQRSVAPPGRSARLDEVTGFWGNIKHYRLEVSEGVALAVTCNLGAPCEKMKVTSDDPAIAEVRPASLSALESTGYGTAAQSLPSSAFVILGKQPGTTRIHVTSKDGNRDVRVTVIAPPAPAAPQTVAASTSSDSK